MTIFGMDGSLSAKRIIVKQEKMQRTILSYLNACGMNQGMVVMLGLKAFLLVQ